MKCMELVAMLCIVFIVLSTTLPISSSIRTYSTSVIHNTTTAQSNRIGFSFPLLHRNHPEIERRFGSIEHQEPLEVAPITKNKTTKGFYYVNFLVGSEQESVFAILDTGSGFTWLSTNKLSSSTYKSLTCQDAKCRDVPNNYCDEYYKQCLFDVRYVGNATSSGQVGTDEFHLFDPTEPGSTIGVEMVFGTVFGETDYPGVMGVTGGALGIVTGLTDIQFSACFPMSDKQSSYLRLGIDAYLDGKSTPLVPVPFGHYAFNVSSITIKGSELTNLTWDATKGGTFIFDTGAAFTYLHPVAMDAVVEGVRQSIYADPIPGWAGGFEGYELCYETRYIPALLEFSFEVNGVGSLYFDSVNLWVPYRDYSCLAFKRSTSNRTIYGARQMQGWNFGLDLHDKQLWIEEDANCSFH